MEYIKRLDFIIAAVSLVFLTPAEVVMADC